MAAERAGSSSALGTLITGGILPVPGVVKIAENQTCFAFYLFCRIEKKRSIIPALLEALQTRKTADINLNYFYQMLFTRENLKLVHIACHKKGAHNLMCDTNKMFRTSKNARKAKENTVGKRKRYT